jgi:phosphohistidine swiveling domain-containing protein
MAHYPSIRTAYLALAVLAVPAVAHAQTANESLASAATEFRGEAPGVCVIRGAARLVSSNNASLETSQLNAAAIRVTSLVAADGSGQPNAADLTLSIPVICTVTHDVTILSTGAGMTRDGGAGGVGLGFRSVLDYQVRTSWAGQTLAASASALPSVVTAPDAASGDLLVTVSILQGGQPLVAGSYSDTLTILLTPSL